MTPFERTQLVILSYNRMDCLPRLFNELLIPAANLGTQVTFVDNASDSNVKKFLADYKGKINIEIILSDTNLGVARGRNIGFSRSNREYVVYLDDDSMMTLEDLASIPQLFDGRPDTGIFAFRVIHGLTHEPQNEHGATDQIVGNFHGAGHAIRSSLFQCAGYLDEKCFFGAEELEFTMRVRIAGMKTIYLPQIIVKHFSLTRSGTNQLRRRSYWARNYAMVLFRYLPFSKAALFSFRLLVSYVVSGIQTIKLGVLFLPPAMLVGAVMGLRSRKPLDAAGVSFYTDPNTRPELGNVSVTSKLLRRLNQGA